MKTKKHGNGLSHEQVVWFSNRLARMSGSASDFERGWSACAHYFAHELRAYLRLQEDYDYVHFKLNERVKQ